MKDGNFNAKFFYHSANTRAKVNNINKLQVNGEWIYEKESIQNGITDFFSNLFHNPFVARPHLLGLKFGKILEDKKNG